MQTNDSIIEMIINKISSMIGIDQVAMKSNYAHFAGNGAFLGSVFLFGMGNIATIKERLQLLYILLAIFSLMIGLCLRIYNEREAIKSILSLYGKNIKFKGEFLLKFLIVLFILLAVASIIILTP
jgi:hypothetical protein